MDEILLDLKLLYERESRNCSEDMVVSVLSWLGRRHELMYGESWGFGLENPRSEHITGEQIKAGIGDRWGLLEKYHGVRLIQKHISDNTELSTIIHSELLAGYPIRLAQLNKPLQITKHRDITEPSSKDILIEGFIKSEKAVHYLSYNRDVDDNHSDFNDKAERSSVEELISERWDLYTTLRLVGSDRSNEVDGRKIVEDALLRLKALDSDSVFSLMKCFGHSVSKSLDLEIETSGHSRYFFVPLFSNLMRVSQGRYQFARLLQYLVEEHQILEFQEISQGLEALGREWSLIRSLLMKASLMPSNEDLRGRVSERIERLADREEETANALLQLCKNGSAVSFELNKLGSSTLESLESESSSRARYARPAEMNSVYVGPDSEVQKTLVSIWQDVLGIEQIGIHDNFFELGGDSLLIMRCVAKARRCDLRFSAKQFFVHQTIAELAKQREEGSTIDAEQGIVAGPVPMLPRQYQTLELFGLEYDYGYYGTIQHTFDMPRGFRPIHLEKITQQLFAHHDALRTSFVRNESGWQQSIGDIGRRLPCQWVDLSEISVNQKAEEMVTDVLQEDIKSHINLSKGPLFNATIVERGKDKRLLMAINHIVSEGLSYEILREDFEMVCSQLIQGEPIQLPSKTTSFKYWAERLRTYVRSDEFQQEVDYWMNLSLSEIRPLPVECTDNDQIDYGTAILARLTLSPERTRNLFRVVRALHSNINEVLLTILAQTVARWSEHNTVLIEKIHHGRDPIFDEVDLSRTVGLFVFEVPLLLDLGEMINQRETLERVADRIRRVPNMGIGYTLLRYMSEDREVAEKLTGFSHCQARYNSILVPHSDQGLCTSNDSSDDISIRLIEEPVSWPVGTVMGKPFAFANKVWLDEGKLEMILGLGFKGQFRSSTREYGLQCYVESLDAFIAYFL